MYIEHIYIGSCVNFGNRLAGHKLDCGRGKGNRNLQNFVNEYGWKNIIFKILEEVPIESLKEKENFWISKYDFNNLWNIAPKAYSNKGVIMPDSHKEKCSERMKGTTHCRGYKHSKEKGEKCAAFWKNNPDKLEEMKKANREAQTKIDRKSWKKGSIIEVYLNGNLLETIFGVENIIEKYPFGYVMASKLLTNKKESYNGYELKRIGKYFITNDINNIEYYDQLIS